MSDAGTLWYFAYGSNLDPERFAARVGRWRELRRASLRSHCLRFSADVTSEGGGGAIIVPGDGVVHGAAFRISLEQLEALDAVEFDPTRNPDELGERREVEIESDAGPLRAQVYTITPVSGFRALSATYLGHILRGLEAVGHSPEAIDAVRAVASAEAAGA